MPSTWRHFTPPGPPSMHCHTREAIEQGKGIRPKWREGKNQRSPLPPLEEGRDSAPWATGTDELRGDLDGFGAKALAPRADPSKRERRRGDALCGSTPPTAGGGVEVPTSRRTVAVGGPEVVRPRRPVVTLIRVRVPLGPRCRSGAGAPKRGPVAAGVGARRPRGQQHVRTQGMAVQGIAHGHAPLHLGSSAPPLGALREKGRSAHRRPDPATRSRCRPAPGRCSGGAA